MIYLKYLGNLKYVEELFSELLENLLSVAFGSSSFSMACFINESLFEKKCVDTFEKKKIISFFLMGWKIANLQRSPKLLDVHSKQDKYEEGNSFVTVYIRM